MESTSAKNGHFRILADSLALAIQENDCDGVITYSNKAHHDMLGYEFGELCGKKIWDLVPSKDERISLQKHVDAVKNAKQTAVHLELQQTRKDGEVIDLQFCSTGVFDAMGRVQSITSIVSDVTETKRKNTSLRLSTAGLASLHDASKSLVGTFDLDQILQATVDGTTKLSGLDTAAIYLLVEDSLYLHATTPPLPAQFPDHLRTASLVDHPHIQRAINAREPVFLPDVRQEGIELTPSETMVVEQRNLRTLLFLPLITTVEVMGALIVGSIEKPAPISTEEIHQSYTFANLAALAVKNSRLFVSGQEYAAQLERTLEERNRAEEEKEALQKQLLQIQKMEAIGQLAGGIAHDFNNQLSGILGFAELLYNDLEDSLQRKYAAHILQIAERSAHLTAQLLAFSRKGQFQIVDVDLHNVVNEVVAILEHTISRKIIIQKKLAAGPCITTGDPSQIQNALLNIVLNARDAMPDGGELTIDTQHTLIRPKDRERFGIRLQPGSYIQLAVTDTGTGIDPQNIDHIFEPFFSTKKPGKGTGMGLSAVYGTMKGLGGDISVYSKPGHGTTFKLYFPFEHGPLQESKTTIEAQNDARDSASAQRPSKQILVVDDEETVAYTITEFLKSDGHLVQSFTDSQKALDYFNENHQSISLVILDLIMPKLDGSELYRSMITTNPSVPFLLSSGFGINVVAKATQNESVRHFIRKPFRRADLLGAVRTALSETSTDQVDDGRRAR